MRRQHVAVMLGVVLVVAMVPVVTSHAQKPKDTSMTLRVSPQVSFSPARIVATAELRDVDETSAEFYCPGLEWDWGDGTTSEASFDCEPFEAGKTEIKKRYTSEHTYNTGGRYRVQLKLKRQRKVILTGSASLQVRPGSRDGIGY